MTMIFFVKKIVATGVTCASVLFPLIPVSAAPPPASAALTAEGEGAGAILMGVAVAASTQSADQQQTDRAALRKELQHLLATRMFMPPEYDRPDSLSRIVRIVFDIGPDGRTTNVRVGKRSGNGFTDGHARAMVVRFTGLPGGERRRVCAVLQYGASGQVASDAVFIQARKDATDSAIADLIAGRDGPNYDKHGRIVL